MAGQSARLSYDYDMHLFKIDCLKVAKGQVSVIFAAMLNQFLDEQVGQNVKVRCSNHPPDASMAD